MKHVVLIRTDDMARMYGQVACEGEYGRTPDTDIVSGLKNFAEHNIDTIKEYQIIINGHIAYTGCT